MEIPHSWRTKEVTVCQILQYEWVMMRAGQDAELKAKKYQRKNFKNAWKIWVLKICESENYASKYGILVPHIFNLAKIYEYCWTPLLRFRNLCFTVICNIFSDPFNFHILIMHCFSLFYVSEIWNFPRFTSVAHLEREQFWLKMVSAEKTFAIYIFWALKGGTDLT
jgi:hypothetical protein